MNQQTVKHVFPLFVKVCIFLRPFSILCCMIFLFALWSQACSDITRAWFIIYAVYCLLYLAVLLSVNRHANADGLLTSLGLLSLLTTIIIIFGVALFYTQYDCSDSSDIRTFGVVLTTCELFILVIKYIVFLLYFCSSSDHGLEHSDIV